MAKTTTKAAAPKKPAGDAKAAAPRRNVSEQTEAPLGTLGSGNGNVRAQVSDDELRDLIAQTAYYKAQQRGFAPGYEQRDWLEAETEVMHRLGMRS